MTEVWFQITAGKGPMECAWAVVQVLEKVGEEASFVGLEARVLEIEPGPQPGTAQSAVVALSGDGDLQSFIKSWCGTVQWIARSPYRPEHKRKNWFVGIEILEAPDEPVFDPKDVRWETMRASGPGGQHVNRTESAVRVTHLPTGLQASAAEERSQHRNRKLALARLVRKLADVRTDRERVLHQQRWRSHQELERGNPIRTFRSDS